MRKVGIICFENPFIKPSTGGKKGILSRIYSLIELDISLDIYLINMPKDQDANIDEICKLSNKISNVFQYKSKNKFSQLFGKFPLCNNRRYLKDCILELSKHEYDFFICEGEQIAKYRMKNKINAKKHIIYMHDIESNYRKELSKAQTNFILKFMQRRESKKFLFIEKQIDAFFDDVWFVSKDELNNFKNRISDTKGLYIPLPATYICKSYEHSESNSHTMLYIGDLALKNNLLSLKWFIDKVMPIIVSKIPDAQLKVIGNIKDDDKNKISNKNVLLCGYVDDVSKQYYDSACFVCPVIFGAGVKVKTIDALSYGSVVVTTSKGIEGTDLKNEKHLFVEDNPTKQAEIISKILLDNKKYFTIAERGLDFVGSFHSIENQSILIYKSFNDLLTK